MQTEAQARVIHPAMHVAPLLLRHRPLVPRPGSGIVADTGKAPPHLMQAGAQARVIHPAVHVAPRLLRHRPLVPQPGVGEFADAGKAKPHLMQADAQALVIHPAMHVAPLRLLHRPLVPRPGGGIVADAGKAVPDLMHAGAQALVIHPAMHVGPLRLRHRPLVPRPGGIEAADLDQRRPKPFALLARRGQPRREPVGRRQPVGEQAVNLAVVGGVGVDRPCQRHTALPLGGPQAVHRGLQCPVAGLDEDEGGEQLVHAQLVGALQQVEILAGVEVAREVVSGGRVGHDPPQLVGDDLLGVHEGGGVEQQAGAGIEGVVGHAEAGLGIAAQRQRRTGPPALGADGQRTGGGQQVNRQAVRAGQQRAAGGGWHAVAGHFIHQLAGGAVAERRHRQRGPVEGQGLVPAGDQHMAGHAGAGQPGAHLAGVHHVVEDQQARRGGQRQQGALGLILRRELGGKVKLQVVAADARQIQRPKPAAHAQLEGAAGITAPRRAGELPRELALADARRTVEHQQLVGGGVAEGGFDGLEQGFAADEGMLAAGGDVAAKGGGRGGCGDGGKRAGRRGGGEPLEGEPPFVVGGVGEEAGIDGPHLGGAVLVTDREDAQLGAIDGAVERPVGPLAGVVARSGGQVHDPAGNRLHALHLVFVEVAAQDHIHLASQPCLDVAALDVAEPVEGMMNQRHPQRGILRAEGGDGVVEAAPPDNELGVIVPVDAKQGAVDGQHGNAATPNVDALHRAAGAVGGQGANAPEVVVVPVAKGAHLLREMRFGPRRGEVAVGLLGAEGARQADPLVAVDIVIAGDHEELAPLKAGGGEDGVEESAGRGIFRGLAGLGDVAGGEDQVGLAALLAVGAHGANQRTQDHVTVVGVATPEMEVGDVQPAESHDRRSAQSGKGCRTSGLIGRTSF